MFTIRPFREDEAALYRDIRLEGLRLHPDAFSASYEREVAEPLDFFARRLSAGGVFAGRDDRDVLGTVAFVREIGPKIEHKAHLFGMYVRPAARGTGLAGMLVQTLLDHARETVELVQLSVSAGNTAARRLYARHGFEPFGVERHSTKLGDDYVDAVHMVKLFD
jgi:RimJ/RimL family protein N-acetyltransferase